MPLDASNSPAGLAQFVAYVCTDQGAAVAHAVLARSGGKDATVHGGGLSGAARMASNTPHARIILAEIGNIPIDMACDCVAEICNSGAEVIVLGDQTDISTYRSLRRAGATEYFSFPITAEDILATQRHPSVHRAVIVQLPAPTVKSPSIAVIGSRGGVGASILAQNLAFYGSSTKGAKISVGLLDADLQFGTQAIDLDRDETAGLFEALMAPDRIDETFINATMDHVNDRLAFYSHQVGAGQQAAAYEAGLARLIAPLRSQFGAVVTDLPRGLIFERSDLANQLDAVVLVIPAGFAGVNAASRLIRRIAAQNPELRILPVLSELRRDAGLSVKDIRTTIGLNIIATLPRCDALMARAQRAARPIVDCQARSPYAKAVNAIWTAAMVRPKATESSTARPLLRRIFG